MLVQPFITLRLQATCLCRCSQSREHLGRVGAWALSVAVVTAGWCCLPDCGSAAWSLVISLFIAKPALSPAICPTSRG